MIGIYKITNLVNNKVYIGQSIDIENRWRQHIQKLNNNRHINKHLQSSWNKYTSKCFSFSVICECTEDKLTEMEQYWIDMYGGINSGLNYNNRDAGNKGRLSKESIRKCSESAKKVKHKPLSESTKLKISNTMKGRPCNNKGYRHSEEIKKYISMCSKGKKRKPRSTEHRKKLSESLKGKPAWNKGIPSSMKGTHLSEDTITRLRDLDRKNKYAVAQYDLQGNLLNTFQSTMEAERKTGIKNSGISACCRGLQKTAGGFIWKKVVSH